MAIVKASKVQRDINDKILVTSAGLKEVQNQKIVKVKELIKEFDKTQDALKKEEIEALIHQIDVLGQVIAYYNNLNDINKNGYITHNIKKQNDFVNDLTKAIQLIENANGAGSINSLKKDLNRVLLSSGENKYIFKGITGLSERIKNYADNIKKEQLQAQISYLPNISDIGILSALTTNQLEQFYKVRTSNDLNTKANNAIKFLKKGDKVKVELRFRGRELGHKDIGKEVMIKFIDIVKEFGEPAKAPAFEGNNMVVIIDPKK